MPLTSQQKSARCRSKLKEQPEKYLLHKQKDAERKRAKKATLSQSELAAHTEKNRVNVAKFRQKAAEKNSSSVIESSPSTSTTNAPESSTKVTPFRTPQVFGKAKRKLETSLPSSPNKRRKIIEHFATVYTSFVPQRPEKNDSLLKLPPETVSKVRDFYEENEISWQAPGKKDFILVRTKDGKERIQKRFLLMTLKEAYSIFCTRDGAPKIGFTKFTELRPQHVLLQRKIPHTVCTCRIHENIRFLLICLNRSGLKDIPITFRTFIDKVVCNQDNKKCMMMQCEQCPGIQHLQPSDDHGEEESEWDVWTNKNPVSKISKPGTVADCFQELHESLPTFLEHTFIKREQADYFSKKITNPENGEVVVQLDFSENYECKEQSEIQSAHWSHQQITVFWFKMDEEVQAQSFAFTFISDYLSHDKYAVHVFLMNIVEFFKQKLNYTNISLHVFSDGAASQFKQTFTLLCNLTFLEVANASWHFFATSHGKGAVDGIGGQVKRDAWLAAMSGAKINNASDFCSALNKKEGKIIIEKVHADEIEGIQEFLDQRWEGIESIPNTHKVHCVTVESPHVIKCSFYSSSEDFRLHRFLETVTSIESNTPKELRPLSSISKEQYYAVYYDSQFYIGRCIQTDPNLVIKFLTITFNDSFSWPKKDDISVVEQKYIFYGPVTLVGTEPFYVEEINEIKKEYKRFKKTY